jgi:hypothetical protein
MCGAKSRNRVYLALWVYNRLLQCCTVAQIEREKAKKFPMMHQTDLQYLNFLTDESQYPAARCAKDPGVYIYHRTLSAMVESMNAANRDMQAKTAVDPLNACILLIRMECKQIINQRRLAWAMETELTSRGKVEYDKVFTNISSFDFTINVIEGLLDYTCTVRKNVNANSRVGGTVTILKEPICGSYFGKCTCGVNTRDAVLCEHMAAIVVSSCIPQLTQGNIMPYWWQIDHWKKQFAKDVLEECNVSMETICEDGQPNDKIMYCPSWRAPNKAG